MNPKHYIPVLLIIIPYLLNAQLNPQHNIQPDPRAMKYYEDGYRVVSPSDSVYLVNLPEMRMPENYRNRDLPYKVDNSVFPYLRPVFNQDGASCGQAGGVGYHFTYEINHARNLPANVPENQYPTHFTWNFMNPEGNLVGTGVSFFHSFEILEKAGCPNVADYGGMSRGDSTRWMSGYEKYYNGMFNRISEVYSIDISNTEGLTTLKHWLNDHHDGSEAGGVANYYAGIVFPYQLPQGTEEAGKNVILQWYTIATHTMTIVGYNDSIRFDYNQDGQYTNDIDINGDGIVDMKDWEIGGFKFVNSYGIEWGDAGFCYVMYKTMADAYGAGGIWDNRVFIVKTNEDYQPKLTMNVGLTHTSREQIRVTAGVSLDTDAIFPTHTIKFPIFNYQGGNFFMQGAGIEEFKKTIEFGLDITPLLGYIQPGQPAKFFLQVDENDPENRHVGQIDRFSVIDYTNGTGEAVYPGNDIPLIDNFVTTLGIEKLVDFNNVTINDLELPPAMENQSFEYQFNATGGEPPYDWLLMENFTYSMFEGDFPEINDEDLIPQLNTYGMVSKKLDFSFPFYGQVYDSVLVHAQGYILFDDIQYPWPYIKDLELLLSSARTIAPMMNRYLLPYPELGKGIWYEGDDNHATFRWKFADSEDLYGTDYNVAMTIWPDGTFEFFYGDMVYTDPVDWIAGVSAGDKVNYTVASASFREEILKHTNIRMFQSPYPQGLSLSSDGLLSGTPVSMANIYDLTVCATDQNKISDQKQFQLSSGLLVNHTIKGGNDHLITQGEDVYIDLTLKNLRSVPILNLHLDPTIDDNYFSLIEHISNLGSLQAGEEITIENALLLKTAQDVPDKYNSVIRLDIQSDNDSWISYITLEATASRLCLGDVIIDSENGLLDPGETSDITIKINNLGHASAFRVIGTLNTYDPFISINESNILNYGTVAGRSNNGQSIEITVNPNTPQGYSAWMRFDIIDSTGIMVSDSFSIQIGINPVLIIDLDENQSSAPGIQNAILEHKINVDYRTYLPEWDLWKYKGLFICLGVFPRNYELDASSGESLAGYLNSGGNIYMEGGSTWYVDDQTEVHPFFNINPANTGWSTGVDTINGYASTFAEGIKMKYDGENFKLDNLTAISPAIELMQDIKTGLCYTVAHDGVYYKTIGSSYEFGGLTDTLFPSTKKELIKRYLDFFNINTKGYAANFMADHTKILNGEAVQFTDISSEETVVWNWDFPGGQPVSSTLQNPEVIYDSTGIYDVVLTVSDGTNTNTLFKSGYIYVGSETGIEKNNPLSDQVFIYPNPVKDQINIQLKDHEKANYTISLLNSLGATLSKQTYSMVKNSESIQIRTNDYPTGIYYLNILGKKNSFSHKFIIIH